MHKEDWVRVAKMMGYVYIPIALLIVGIFILVQYQSAQITKDKDALTPKAKLIVPAEIEKLPQ